MNIFAISRVLLMLVFLLFPHQGKAAFFRSRARVCINEILVNNASANMDMYFNKFSCWIELYNGGSEEKDISGYYLTDNIRRPRKWEIPPCTVIPAKGFVLFWADGENAYDHTNFKLNSSGEMLCLTDPGGMVIDEIAYVSQIPDVSYGRYPDGGSRWFYFASPTPNGSNKRPYRSRKRAASPDFNAKGGFYQAPMEIEVSGNPSGVIRYTTDGSIPGENSPVYKAPLMIDSTTVVRARVFHESLLPSPVSTNTYFINEKFTLPAVSVSMAPEHLWNGKTGIYVMGEDAKLEFPYWGANFRAKWERPANIEFYGQGGERGFSVEAGVRTAGTTSLGNAMKSLSFRLRRKYGQEEFHYRIFENRPYTGFRSFVLRNSGDDWASGVFRDAMMKKICEGIMDLDSQASRPVIVFINGEYWGIHYLTEKIDEFFLASNHNLDPSAIDLLTYSPDLNDFLVRRAIAGSTEEYDMLTDFIEKNDLSAGKNYRRVKNLVDINSYLDYAAMQAYIGNKGWFSNLKFWRPRDKRGRWRWILYDTDLGFGLHAKYFSDTIRYATDIEGGGWQNPPHLTLMFRKLLANKEFRDDFIQRLAGYLNTAFQPERVMRIIESCREEIEPEMPGHIEKWKGQLSCHGFPDLTRFPSTMKKWESNVEVMRTFARERPGYLRRYIIKNFSLNGTITLSLQTVNPEGGRVSAAGVYVPGADFKGVYFKDIPLRLKAAANRGYNFKGWEGISAGTLPEVSIIPENDIEIRAVFEYAGS